MQKKIFIKSYGCQMNVYDSDRMLDLMKPYGYDITYEIKDASLIILNTCHIREKATEKVYSEIGKINKLKKGENYKLIIAGCVAQAEGEEIKKRAPTVNAIVGPQSYHMLPNIVSKFDKKHNTIVNTDFLTKTKFDKLQFGKPNSSSVFVTIQEGCNKFCTFCVVPYTRGAEYSRPIQDIINEINNYSKNGVKEITLLGQNVNSYHGLDTNQNERRLDYLINKISEIDSIKRIRYMTSHPTDMDKELINCHKYNDKLMPFVHLPIQTGSDKILKLMNRNYKVNEYLRIIEKLRLAKEDIALSSDFIVGFPGETDKDFDQTMRLIEKVKFSIAYSFCYSLRPGTPASNLSDQIDYKIKKERLYILQSLLKKQQKSYNEKFIGRNLEILFEKIGKHKNQFVGRSVYNQSVFMNSQKNLLGSIIKANINNTTNFALSAIPSI